MEISCKNHKRQSFILLINVKNANNCWHFNIYEQDKFYLSWAEQEKSFITSWSGLFSCHRIACYLHTGRWIKRFHHCVQWGQEIPTRGSTVPVGNEAFPSFPLERWTRGLGFPGSTAHQWSILFLTYLIKHNFYYSLARHCGLLCDVP